MILKTIPTILVLTVCLLITINISAQNTIKRDELIGKYATKVSFTGWGFELKADGTFLDKYYSCTFETEQSGNFTFSNEKLHFTVLKYIGKKYAIKKKEINLFNPKNRRKFYDYDKDEEDEKVITEYDLLPVRWGERIYLIDEDEMLDFINAVNFGFEPRNENFNLDVSWSPIYLRKGDENKLVQGKPELPTKWLSFILDSPVSAKIISLKEQEVGKIATIDKGSIDGLKVGMRLTTTKDAPNWWSKEGEIISVSEKTAEIFTYRLTADDIVSTKFISK